MFVEETAEIDNRKSCGLSVRNQGGTAVGALIRGLRGCVGCSCADVATWGRGLGIGEEDERTTHVYFVEVEAEFQVNVVPEEW